MVPQGRIRTCNAAPVRADGDFVLYWMVAQRRCRSNFALDRALEHARALGRPLVVLEALRIGYRWASDRFHAFILEGMADNERSCQGKRVTYYPYVEEHPGEGSGLVETAAQRAAVVVTDDFPCFFLPRMIEAAAARMPVRLEAVDSNGLLPMSAASGPFSRAYDFRRYLQRHIPLHLHDVPHENPLVELEIPTLEALPAELTQRWAVASPARWLEERRYAQLPIDHGVPPVTSTPGGSLAARAALRQFIAERLDSYGKRRSDPASDTASGLSPYLHFGHVSAHEIFGTITSREGWSRSHLGPKTTGQREGWWGMSSSAESFLDELVTWRELGYNFCAHSGDYDQYSSLPEWARATLDAHAADPREHVYTMEQFESAATHDPLWNAAQVQLRREGKIHNYLRMLWGKKVLHWTATPQDALAILEELNNKYALDGRNPNSYSGIFWVLGRYDHPWSPERPIFGTVRYMTSESTRAKFKVDGYVQQYSRG